MKFVSMKKVNEGKFLSRYDIVYETVDGGVKNYEMVSRAKNRTQFDQLHDHKPEAVIMIMHDPSGENCSSTEQFRLAMGELSTISLPAWWMMGKIWTPVPPESCGRRLV